MNSILHHLHHTDAEIRALIRQGKIVFGGNKRLRIYGLLTCASGKRMKRENRVFFISMQEAEAAGYRACKRCL